MPRFLRPNSAIRGNSYYDSSKGIYTPAAAAADQLIVPQVIDWPWSTDDAGVAFPAGLKGIRSVAPARATERAWATAGDPTEGQDLWIAVPGTLPGGYTARHARDADRGFMGALSSRGTPYLTVAANGSGDAGSAASNYAAIGGAPVTSFRMLANWTVNGLTPHAGAGKCPSYRPTGGGGIVPLTWHPVNVSKKVLPCRFFDANIGRTFWEDAGYADSWLDGATHPSPNLVGAFVPNGSMALWTPTSVGFRAARVRCTIFADALDWAYASSTDVGAQFFVRHNANGSTTALGDTADYTSPLYRKADFVDAYDAGGGFHLYVCERVLDLTAYLPTKAQGLRRWCIGFEAGTLYLNRYTGGPTGYIWAQGYNGTSGAAGTPGYDYGPRVDLCPRVDVPPWFSVYGAGLGAPGGV